MVTRGRATEHSPFRRALLKSIRRREWQPLWEFLHRLTIIGQNYWSSTVSESGEKVVLQWLGKRILAGGVVVDVGANQGQYASAVANILSPRKVYSFEPSAATFAILETELRRCDLDSVVSPRRLALGEFSGRALLHTSHAGAPTASLHNLRNPVTPFDEALEEWVELSTLDEFASKEGIARIDLLKIDVEGHELAVLQGASRLLGEGRIDHIQFEFGEANLDSRTYYRDFHDLLGRDFDLYRIVSNGLRAQGPYHPRHEIFATMNYLAVRKRQ